MDVKAATCRIHNRVERNRTSLCMKSMVQLKLLREATFKKKKEERKIAPLPTAALSAIR